MYAGMLYQSAWLQKIKPAEHVVGSAHVEGVWNEGGCSPRSLLVWMTRQGRCLSMVVWGHRRSTAHPGSSCSCCSYSNYLLVFCFGFPFQVNTKLVDPDYSVRSVK